MSTLVKNALNTLRELSSPEELRQLARTSSELSQGLKVNAHIHLPPNFSAFDSVEQAVDLAAAEGLGVLGVSNYYDYEVYGDFVARAQMRGIFPMFGLEIIILDDRLLASGVKANDPGNPGKVYICGKGITRFHTMSAEAERLLGVIRKNDSDRMATLVERLDTVLAERDFTLGIDEDAVVEGIIRRHGSPRETIYLQERHAAQAFQEGIFERVEAGDRLTTLKEILGVESSASSPGDHVSVQNDLRAHLMKSGKPAFVEETFVSLAEAKSLILELGGIPSYPTLADGATPIGRFEEPVEALVENILNWNIHAAEFIPLRNAPETLSAYVPAMREAGLAVTAGTEHNTLDLIPLEPRCVGGVRLPEEVEAIFWEGACVVAAHQFLTLHGECGYVDEAGNPNPDFDDADARIRHFASLGSALIRKYADETGKQDNG